MADVMTVGEYRRAMFWGRIAYHVYMAVPTWLPYSWFTWLQPASGFYAHDDGYINHRDRTVANRVAETLTPAQRDLLVSALDKFITNGPDEVADPLIVRGLMEWSGWCLCLTERGEAVAFGLCSLKADEES